MKVREQNNSDLSLSVQTRLDRLLLLKKEWMRRHIRLMLYKAYYLYHIHCKSQSLSLHKFHNHNFEIPNLHTGVCIIQEKRSEATSLIYRLCKFWICVSLYEKNMRNEGEFRSCIRMIKVSKQFLSRDESLNPALFLGRISLIFCIVQSLSFHSSVHSFNIKIFVQII